MGALYIDLEDRYRYLRWTIGRCTPGPWADGATPLAVLESQDGTKQPDDPILAVCVMNEVSGDQAQVHFASDTARAWSNRNIIAGIFGYAFVLRGMRRLEARVPANRQKAIIAVLKLGFQIEARLRSSAPDGSDAIVFSMTRQECPWLEEGTSP